MRASKALPLLRVVEQDLSDLCPWAVQDRAPLAIREAQLALVLAPPFEILVSDADQGGIGVDPLDNILAISRLAGRYAGVPSRSGSCSPSFSVHHLRTDAGCRDFNETSEPGRWSSFLRLLNAETD